MEGKQTDVQLRDSAYKCSPNIKAYASGLNPSIPDPRFLHHSTDYDEAIRKIDQRIDRRAHRIGVVRQLREAAVIP